MTTMHPERTESTSSESCPACAYPNAPEALVCSLCQVVLKRIDEKRSLPPVNVYPVKVL